MKKLLIAALLFSPASARAVEFSYQYTFLATDCVSRGGGEGSDPITRCKGYGGYRIYLNYSASATQLVIEDEANGEQAASVQTIDHEKGAVEWRFADGRPFAIIARSFETDAEGRRSGRQTLEVRGLKGFEHIRDSIDARDPIANLRARDAADAGYPGPRR